jgi:limonene 1,2-monooxygenase
MITMVRNLQEITGGFGVLLGFAHDWAGREATMRSWELFARHVVPELNGYARNLKASAEYAAQHRTELASGMVQSVMAAVGEDEVAKAALAVTMGKLGGSQRGSI